jgi:hypothetical protein
LYYYRAFAQCTKKERGEKKRKRIKEGITKREFRFACSKFKPATVKIGNVLYAMIFNFFSIS